MLKLRGVVNLICERKGLLDPAKKILRKEMEKAVLGSGFGNKKAIFVCGGGGCPE